jgi:hypothetical protein
VLEMKTFSQLAICRAPANLDPSGRRNCYIRPRWLATHRACCFRTQVLEACDFPLAATRWRVRGKPSTDAAAGTFARENRASPTRADPSVDLGRRRGGKSSSRPQPLPALLLRPRGGAVMKGTSTRPAQTMQAATRTRTFFNPKPITSL